MTIKKRKKRRWNYVIAVALETIFLLAFIVLVGYQLYGKTAGGEENSLSYQVPEPEKVDNIRQEERAFAASANGGSLSEKVQKTVQAASGTEIPSPTHAEENGNDAEELLSGMTLEEKVYQLFIITPEALTGASQVTAAGKTTKQKLEQYPVGGLIYFAQNLTDPAQTTEMLHHTMQYSYDRIGLPIFLCVDEEGGRVARIAKNPAFGVEDVGCMQNIKDAEAAYQAGKAIGTYLLELGFNFDFAPDADVLTNDRNTVIGDRSFGTDPDRVTELAVAVSKGLQSKQIRSTFKHFPGHGATLADTHDGFAYTDKTYEELLQNELMPFRVAEEEHVDAVMVAHIAVPSVTGDNMPCSLSAKMITGVLREDLGYQGLIVTDSLAMGAITQKYSSAEAAVMAIQAGADLLLMPADFEQAAQGILKAVSENQISEERINESVLRIIQAKRNL